MHIAQANKEEVQQVAKRLAALGLSCAPGRLDRALVAVCDQPFLKCVGNLPRPGSNLMSVPGSGGSSPDSTTHSRKKGKKKGGKKTGSSSKNLRK